MNALNVTIVRADAPQDVAALVADRLLTLLTSRTAAMHQVHVVLTGGTVAALVHRRCAAQLDHRGDDIDWSSVHLWWGDERWLQTGDAERNDAQADADLLARLPVPQSNVHRFPAAPSSSAVHDGAALRTAAHAMAEEVLARAPETFDLVMLGTGPDGHVASLFPGHPVHEVSTDVAAVENSPKPPPSRLTLSQSRLARTDEMWIFATGAAKADAVSQAHAAAALPLGTVTRAAAATGARVTWFLDAEAVSLLSE